ELYNGGNAAVNLGGWYLTDDPATLTKWAFPGTNIAAKGFMVVFASGKDRRVAGLPLHTSFGLGSGGEYLALVMADGVTIATEFSPAYPKQFADISYGIGQSVTTTYFITSNSAAKVFVPTGPLTGNWTTNDFNDTSWLRGTNGVGYETSVAGFAVRNYKANVQITTIGTAETLIATPSQQTAVYSENSPVINYLNTGSSAHYG